MSYHRKHFYHNAPFFYYFPLQDLDFQYSKVVKNTAIVTLLKSTIEKASGRCALAVTTLRILLLNLTSIYYISLLYESTCSTMHTYIQMLLGKFHYGGLGTHPLRIYTKKKKEKKKYWRSFS